MSRVLVLRPEPGARATAERARKLGLDPVVLPLFEVEPIPWTAPDASGFDGVLLTSANAVRMAGDQLSTLRGLPAHAVGEATADAARDAGFDIASRGEAGVERLLDSLEPDLKLLHLCGEDRHEAQVTRQLVTAIVVYRSKELPDVDLRPASAGVALIHSPRAGRRFAELVDRASIVRGGVTIAAISPAAAEAAGEGWARVEAAERPADDVLLALAARLCNKPPPQ
jgi:uroporphyrinogen-III synthase